MRAQQAEEPERRVHRLNCKVEQQVQRQPVGKPLHMDPQQQREQDRAPQERRKSPCEMQMDTLAKKRKRLPGEVEGNTLREVAKLLEGRIGRKVHARHSGHQKEALGAHYTGPRQGREGRNDHMSALYHHTCEAEESTRADLEEASGRGVEERRAIYPTRSEK